MADGRWQVPANYSGWHQPSVKRATGLDRWQTTDQRNGRRIRRRGIWNHTPVLHHREAGSNKSLSSDDHQ